MTCDRERRHARSLDRARCERFDNPKRPKPSVLLADYTEMTIERIADRYGVPLWTAAGWIDYARKGVKQTRGYFKMESRRAV